MTFSFLKPKYAKAWHTFILADFPGKIKEPFANPMVPEKSYCSAKFTAPDPFDKGAPIEFQIVVTNRKGTAMVLADFQVRLTSFSRGDQYFPLPFKCQFSFLGDSGQTLNESDTLHGHFQGLGDATDGHLTLDDIHLMSWRGNYLRPDDSLALRCLVKLNCGEELAQEENIFLDPDQLLNRRLSSDIFPDFHLISDGIRISCHKHMLASSSEVFNAMLANPTSERMSNEVLITDVDPPTLRKMLEFVYTDDIKKMDGLSHKLILAADKYSMGNLKTFTTNFALNNMSVKNVCDFLSLGDLVKSDILIRKAFEFVQANADEVMKTDEWKGLPQTFGMHMFETAVKFGKM